MLCAHHPLPVAIRAMRPLFVQFESAGQSNRLGEFSLERDATETALYESTVVTALQQLRTMPPGTELQLCSTKGTARVCWSALADSYAAHVGTDPDDSAHVNFTARIFQEQLVAGVRVEFVEWMKAQWTFLTCDAWKQLGEHQQAFVAVPEKAADEALMHY